MSRKSRMISPCTKPKSICQSVSGSELGIRSESESCKENLDRAHPTQRRQRRLSRTRRASVARLAVVSRDEADGYVRHEADVQQDLHHALPEGWRVHHVIPPRPSSLLSCWDLLRCGGPAPVHEPLRAHTSQVQTAVGRIAGTPPSLHGEPVEKCGRGGAEAGPGTTGWRPPSRRRRRCRRAPRSCPSHRWGQRGPRRQKEETGGEREGERERQTVGWGPMEGRREGTREGGKEGGREGGKEGRRDEEAGGREGGERRAARKWDEGRRRERKKRGATAAEYLQ